MKSVIMIAYGFPPEGNAGAYRPLRFVRHLPALGWQPTVVTLNTETYERYDPTLLRDLPPAIQIVRVPNPDPWHRLQSRRRRRVNAYVTRTSTEHGECVHKAHENSVRSWVRNRVREVEGWIYHPDMAKGWIRPAVKEIMTLVGRGKPDVLWATGPPWSSFAVAERVSERTDVPFVLDFRDSWTMTYTDFEKQRPKWARHRDQRTLGQILKKARAIIFRSETEAECFWRKYEGARHIEKIHIISNGYDGEIEKLPLFSGDRCEILYAGTLSSYRWDSLLEAIISLKNSSPELAQLLHLRFVGEGSDALRRAALLAGLNGLITTSGPVARDDLAPLYRQAHALLILERPSSTKGHELLAGAKLFEYLKMGRPILGVLPGGEARKILNRAGVSTVADVNSPAEIVAMIKNLVDVWSNGRLADLIPDRTVCEGYSADHQTVDLVRALDGKMPKRPFIPGVAEIPLSLKDDIDSEN